MKSRITVSIFSAMIVVLSLATGGCSGDNSESTADITRSNIEQSFNSTDSSYAAESSESSSESSDENSSAESEPADPRGEPTIFIGPDDEPIYDTEVTKIINYISETDKKPSEITAEDEYITVFCEGFQYFKEPGNTAYNSYENPEMFDGFEFKGEMPENKNAWKSVNVGDEICGLKLKYAVSAFVMGNRTENDFDKRGTYYDIEDPYLYQYDGDKKPVEFEGSITLTGFLSSSPRSFYFPDGGFMTFCPTENKLPVMCYNNFKTEPNTYSVIGENDATCTVGESLINIRIREDSDNNQQKIEFVDGCPDIGDTVLVRATLSNITYSYGYYLADFSDIEILSDVLAHEDDQL